MANPRYVGESLDENHEQERDLAEMASDLANLRDALQSFDTPGWTYIAALIQEQVEDAVRTLRTRARSMDQIEHARGLIQAYEWLASLPHYIRSEHQRVTDILAQPGDGS